MKYQINFIKSNVRITALYRNGWLVYIEVTRGKDKIGNNWKWIAEAVPARPEEIEVYKDFYITRVKYELVPGKLEKETLFKAANDLWFEFYYNLTDGLDPKFTATDGKALKQILSYLVSQAKSEEEALDLWKFILSNWKSLDKFTQGKTELTYINSHLNNILTQFKNGQTGNRKARNDADDLRNI